MESMRSPETDNRTKGLTRRQFAKGLLGLGAGAVLSSIPFTNTANAQEEQELVPNPEEMIDSIEGGVRLPVNYEGQSFNIILGDYRHGNIDRIPQNRPSMEIVFELLSGQSPYTHIRISGTGSEDFRVAPKEGERFLYFIIPADTFLYSDVLDHINNLSVANGGSTISEIGNLLTTKSTWINIQQGYYPLINENIAVDAMHQALNLTGYSGIFTNQVIPSLVSMGINTNPVVVESSEPESVASVPTPGSTPTAEPVPTPGPETRAARVIRQTNNQIIQGNQPSTGLSNKGSNIISDDDLRRWLS